MDNKRSRSVNWSKEEKDTLLGLIRERIEVIESRSCENRILKRKQEMWQEIVRLFESEHGEGRGILRIKQQWKRMKLISKKSISENKKHPNGTVLTTGTDCLILEILPQQFEKDTSSCDDDVEILDEEGDISQSLLEINNSASSLTLVERGARASSKERESASLPAKEPACPAVLVMQSVHSDSRENQTLTDEIDCSTGITNHSSPELSNESRKRKNAPISSYEEAMHKLHAEKISLQIEMLREKARREEEIHKLEMMYWREIQIEMLREKARREEEIHELKKMYWREKIKSVKQ